MLAGMLLCGGELQASNRMTEMHVCLADAIQKDNRPEISNRLFRSTAVEKEILRVQKLLKNAKLAWMFTNCFPNTLDTTVHFRKGSDGKPDTFVYTGDIHAMWLRDSGAQVWPYVQLANSDPELKEMLAGVILRQFKCINIDPYANAFNDGAIPDGHWMSDLTDMKPELHERKWEIDSLCYPLRLAYHYWKTTGDASIFNEEWIQAITNVLKTFKEQQRKDGVGPYKFQRKTERALDTVSNDGLGAPVKPVGLIVSSFRPSDDATTLQFLIPSNFFAVSSLRKAAEILETVNKKTAFNKNCTDSGINYITAKYAKMTNKNEFIQLMGIGDNDYIVFNQIYKYNNTSKKLYSVSKLDNTACEIVSAKKNRLTLHHGEQPAETGWLTWKMSYKFRNNKLVLTNATTSTVKSTSGYSRKDSYSKLFRKNIFVTAKKLRFYNGKKLAFTVPKGKQVTLKKLTLSKGNIYLQFQYGKKTGWISVNNKNYDFESPYFKKVNSRLAG